MTSDIRAAELKVRFAELDLQKFDQGQRMVDLIEASNKMVQAEAQLMVNRETFRWSTNLAANNAHITSILRKLRVHSRTQAVIAARELDAT